MSLRLFVAIVPPEDVRREIGEVARALRDALGESAARVVKWAPDQNIHVTVKFLGEVEEPLVTRIEKALVDAAGRHQPFEVQPKGVGCFPNPSNPTVLWVGAPVGTEPMGRLASDVENALAPLGFALEGRPFRCHFTIGRVRRNTRMDSVADALASLQTAADALPSFTASELTLMKSDLRPEGPVYGRLLGVPLGPQE